MQDILLRENKIGRDKEHCWVVCLSSTQRILLIELISLGTANETVVNATEIFSFALQKRATFVILVRNPPGGALLPSDRDMGLTNRMFHAGQFLAVPMLDHLIISETQYLSFVEEGYSRKSPKARSMFCSLRRKRSG